MKAPLLPDNEHARLEALRAFQILDSPPEEAFDNITALAKYITGVPIALVSLIDEGRQWFKAKVGLEACETSREISFCGHAIHNPEPFIIENALDDPRFADNPLVTGPPDIRFYCGIPLGTKEGLNLGTLCVIDRRPRQLNPEQVQMLQKLAGQVMSQMEMRIMNRQLGEMAEAAEQANQAKSLFLASMSHEIRTPMNAIIGMTDLALRDTLTPRQHERILMVQESADFLLHLINEILDFSKIEAGRLKIESYGFFLGAVLKRLRQSFLAQVNEKGIALTIELDESVPDRLVQDPYRLEQILMNLISNAVKFTNVGSVKVAVSLLSATEDKVQLRFEVRDTGIGIAEDKLDTIFESFSQAESHTTRIYGGTGLGLTICKRLTELMGGQLTVESVLGEGSCFSFELPFGLKEEVVEPETGGPQGEAMLQVPSLDVLVVEDNRVNQKVITQLLKLLDHQVTMASSGTEAILFATDHQYDLILMDIQLPDMDGFQITRQIRGEGQNRETPIMAVTAQALDGLRDRCLGARMDGFLAKPVNVDSLRRAVSEIWSERTATS